MMTMLMKSILLSIILTSPDLSTVTSRTVCGIRDWYASALKQTVLSARLSLLCQRQRKLGIYLNSAIECEMELRNLFCCSIKASFIVNNSVFVSSTFQFKVSLFLAIIMQNEERNASGIEIIPCFVGTTTLDDSGSTKNVGGNE